MPPPPPPHTHTQAQVLVLAYNPKRTSRHTHIPTVVVNTPQSILLVRGCLHLPPVGAFACCALVRAGCVFLFFSMGRVCMLAGHQDLEAHVELHIEPDSVDLACAMCDFVSRCAPQLEVHLRIRHFNPQTVNVLCKHPPPHPPRHPYPYGTHHQTLYPVTVHSTLPPTNNPRTFHGDTTTLCQPFDGPKITCFALCSFCWLCFSGCAEAPPAWSRREAVCLPVCKSTVYASLGSTRAQVFLCVP